MAEKKLNKKELENVQGLNTKFVNLNIALADTLLNQQNLYKDLEIVRAEFKIAEDDLSEVYGKNAIIDLQTGEVKDSPEEDKEKE